MAKVIQLPTYIQEMIHELSVVFRLYYYNFTIEPFNSTAYLSARTDLLFGIHCTFEMIKAQELRLFNEGFKN